jgi:hypothetical protein
MTTFFFLPSPPFPDETFSPKEVFVIRSTLSKEVVLLIIIEERFLIMRKNE